MPVFLFSFTMFKALNLKECKGQDCNPGSYDGVWFGECAPITSVSPGSGETLGKVSTTDEKGYERCMRAMLGVKAKWALMPAPRRGQVVKDIGIAISGKKSHLAELLSIEMGKIYSESLGEIQEFIDICDFAVGLSRSIPGAVFPSERPEHTLMEMWNPLGIVGIITAFNFPVAVLGWNLAISLVCGNCSIWKGSNTTSLITVATARIISEVLEKHDLAGVFTCITGQGITAGELIVSDPRVDLVSFTGSTAVGRLINTKVHHRFGRAILELGGNNASIILPDADLPLAIRASVFAAVGTCGQRCTSLRRLIIHEDVYDHVVTELVRIYKLLSANKIGDPMDDNTLVGPLHSEESFKTNFKNGLERVVAQGGTIIAGGKRLDRPGIFVEPTLVEISKNADILKEELFCPVLFLIKISSYDEAVSINNSVPQGLSSSIFTKDLRQMFKWIGPTGSDCGLVNVNTSTSGAEIGGAFGGEKETGGGRESGSDSWKQYMRRSTVAINFSTSLPLAQGVRFDV